MDDNDQKNAQTSKVIPIKHWGEGGRPVERLLKRGPETLSDAALLAILIGRGARGKDAATLAREMLGRLGGFNGLMSATHDDLMQIQGIGKAKIAQVLAAMEIVKRRLRRHLTRLNLVENPNHLHDYLRATMGHLTREEVRILYLNASRQLVSEEVLMKGTVEMSRIDPRQVAASAVRKKASALILAHNHTIDLPLISDEDLQVTHVLAKACWGINIPVLDHVVIGRNSCWSMKRHYPGIFEAENEIA